MTTDKRIANIRHRIDAAEAGILRWSTLLRHTTLPSTKRVAKRMIEMYLDRFDLWEERLVQAETGPLRVYAKGEKP